MGLLFLGDPPRAEVWAEVFNGTGEVLWQDEAAVGDPAAVTHLACWKLPPDLSRYPNLRMVISLGAGIDQLGPVPAGLAVVRALSPGITEMVRDWVVTATLMLHRDMPVLLDQATRGDWRALASCPAGARRVGILGLGRIGQSVAQVLSGMGFPVAGLSRSGRAVEGMEVFGPDEEDLFLSRTDLLICLLPLTEETRGKLGAAYLAKLPMGARLVQAGRGPQLDLEALRGALDSGRLTSAMLDVTDPEPLPADHWCWRDPRVVVTPHIASFNPAGQGAEHALEVLRAEREGREVPGLVAADLGY